MNWRERLTLLLGAASPFAVAHEGLAAPATTPTLTDETPRPVGLQRLEFWSDPAHAGQLLQLVGHRSHSSHSSHSSHVSGSGHSSHYSGTPSYRPAPAPAPVYIPPKPAQVYTPPLQPLAPRAPKAAAPDAEGTLSDPAAASGSHAGARAKGAREADTDADRFSQDEIADFVQRVQIALLIRGYDPGPADGVLTEKTREALRAFQRASRLTVSGNIDMDTLHALGVLK